MGLLKRTALKVVAEYEQNFEATELLARAARDAVKTAIADINVPVQEVFYRPKSVTSLRAKLRDRKAKNPRRLLYDAIGCRVVTYYDEDVDVVVDHLKRDLDVHRTVDKRKRLPLKAFGYRSVHLRARLRDTRTGVSTLALLGRREFEIQVRSILEHAWSEVEHEIVYKGGTEYPDAFVRRFAAVAGSLEVLGREFAGLRDEWASLVEHYRNRYREGLDGKNALDGARLAGFLEARFPRGLGWRSAAKVGLPFASHTDRLAVDALKVARVRTANRLAIVLARRRFKRRLDRYTSLQGLPKDRPSHLAVVLLALSVARPEALDEFFPNATADPSIHEALTA